MFFSALSFVSLVFQTVLAFTLINRAIYEMDAEAFDYSSSPSMIVFVRYSLDSMTAGEIDALKPVSDLAHGASVAATVVGVVILLALFISLFLAHRQHRSDVEMRGTVDEIRAEGKRLERQLKQDFEVSAAEGLERLRDLRAGLLGFILFFNARVPPEFDEDPEFNEPDRPAGGQLPSQIDST